MNNNPKKILIIQTAFIGDVILATSLVNQVKTHYPDSQIDFLLRKGNESLLKENKKVSNIIIWNKKKSKHIGLIKLALNARKEKYDLVLNIQRFASSGIFMLLCGAKMKIGFHSNPLSMFFSKKIKHNIPDMDGEIALHEVQRNSKLLEPLIGNDNKKYMPELFFNQKETNKVDGMITNSNYFVLAPSSVWFTKQWHISKWKELVNSLPDDCDIYLIGGPDDKEYIQQVAGDLKNCKNMCGLLTLTESAYLMKNAKRVFVNDSAPVHLASSVNAKTTAIFCSTIKEFGYYPLSEDATVIETKEDLKCRPCGLHGKKECPKGHFNCSETIPVTDVLDTIL